MIPVVHNIHNKLYVTNSNKYLSNAFKEYLEDHWISHQLTVAYTSQQNGVAERMNRTILDLIRSMLRSSLLQREFWAEASTTAVYIRNRVSCRSHPIVRPRIIAG